jgi:hypothetical protein
METIPNEVWLALEDEGNAVIITPENSTQQFLVGFTSQKDWEDSDFQGKGKLVASCGQALIYSLMGKMEVGLYVVDGENSKGFTLSAKPEYEYNQDFTPAEES